MEDEVILIPDKFITVPPRSELLIIIKIPDALSNKILLLEIKDVSEVITISKKIGSAINNL